MSVNKFDIPVLSLFCILQYGFLFNQQINIFLITFGLLAIFESIFMLAIIMTLHKNEIFIRIFKICVMVKHLIFYNLITSNDYMGSKIINNIYFGFTLSQTIYILISSLLFDNNNYEK